MDNKDNTFPVLRASDLRAALPRMGVRVAITISARFMPWPELLRLGAQLTRRAGA
jgi:hypothetical protein